MFDIAFSELLIISIVALIVIGPEKLPKVTRTIGHLLGKAQRYVSDVKSEINREMEIEELRQFKAHMQTTARDVDNTLQQVKPDLDGFVKTTEEHVADTKTDTVVDIAAPKHSGPDARANSQ